MVSAPAALDNQIINNDCDKNFKKHESMVKKFRTSQILEVLNILGGLIRDYKGLILVSRND